MDVSITPAAEKFIKRMLRFGGSADSGFRLVVSAGGCSGLASEFSIETAPKVGDAVLERNGMKFFLPAESRVLLDGVTIDFADTPTQSGLIFHDPKGAACGCSSTSKDAVPGMASISIASIGRRH
ncbi:MAG: HesB/IscA family protein [Steroidobacteraceae bacterium]